MINKKNVLGKRPEELAVKDAIHTAIVSVRAAKPIKPGERCGLNEFNEAVPNAKGPGVADPFLDRISTGDSFWLLLDQDAVPNVQHVWDHPTVNFAPPTREMKRNTAIANTAERMGITYEQLMAACAFVVKNDVPATYPGSKMADEVEKAYERWDLWSEWADETDYEFENQGSACCPEYDYPRKLFAV